MKNSTYLILVICLLSAITLKATTRTLNNNANSPGQYTTIAAAIAASSNGDTILVSGSLQTYGNLPLTKNLIIIGTGHKPQNQDSIPCLFDYVQLYDAGSGSRVMGITCDYIQIAQNNAFNYRFKRCKINIYLYDASPQCNAKTGYIFEECVFSNTVQNFFQTNSCYTWNNWQIRNCVFNGRLDFRGTANYNNVFDHCQFQGNVVLTYTGSPLYGTSFTNCIFYRTSPSTSSANTTFTNCLSYQAADNSFVNNSSVSVNCLTNVNPQFALFPPAGALFEYGHDYHIVNGSPADNYGTDGTDLGLTGSILNIWNQYGVPQIPQVRELNVITPAVSQGGNLQIEVKSYVPR